MVIKAKFASDPKETTARKLVFNKDNGASFNVIKADVFQKVNEGDMLEIGTSYYVRAFKDGVMDTNAKIYLNGTLLENGGMLDQPMFTVEEGEGDLVLSAEFSKSTRAIVANAPEGVTIRFRKLVDGAWVDIESGTQVETGEGNDIYVQAYKNAVYANKIIVNGVEDTDIVKGATFIYIEEGQGDVTVSAAFPPCRNVLVKEGASITLKESSTQLTTETRFEVAIGNTVTVSPTQESDILQSVLVDGQAIEGNEFVVSEGEGDITVSAQFSTTTQTGRKLVFDTSNGASFNVAKAEGFQVTPVSEGDMLEIGASYFVSASKNGVVDANAKIYLNGTLLEKGGWLNRPMFTVEEGEGDLVLSAVFESEQVTARKLVFNTENGASFKVTSTEDNQQVQADEMLEVGTSYHVAVFNGETQDLDANVYLNGTLLEKDPQNNLPMFTVEAGEGDLVLSAEFSVPSRIITADVLEGVTMRFLKMVDGAWIAIESGSKVAIGSDIFVQAYKGFVFANKLIANGRELAISPDTGSAYLHIEEGEGEIKVSAEFPSSRNIVISANEGETITLTETISYKRKIESGTAMAVGSTINVEATKDGVAATAILVDGQAITGNEFTVPEGEGDVVVSAQFSTTPQTERKLVFDTSNGATYRVYDADTETEEVKEGDMLPIGTSWAVDARIGNKKATTVFLNGKPLTEQNNYYRPTFVVESGAGDLVISSEFAAEQAKRRILIQKGEGEAIKLQYKSTLLPIESGDEVEVGTVVIVTAKKEWANYKAVIVNDERIESDEFTVPEGTGDVTVSVEFEAEDMTQYRIVRFDTRDGLVTFEAEDQWTYQPIKDGDYVKKGHMVSVKALKGEEVATKIIADGLSLRLSSEGKGTFTVYDDEDGDILVKAEFASDTQPAGRKLVFNKDNGASFNVVTTDIYQQVNEGDMLEIGTSCYVRAFKDGVMDLSAKIYLNGTPVENGGMLNQPMFTVEEGEGDLVLSAEFSRSCQLTFETVGNGAITAKSGDTKLFNGDTVVEGASVEFSFIASKGYVLDSVWVNNIDVTGDIQDDTYKTTVTGDLVVKAQFKVIDGIERNFANGIRLYPNPFNETFNVEGAAEGTLIQVFDATGACVFVSETTAETMKVDLSGLSAGAYIVRLSNNDGSAQYKMLKK